MNIRISMLAALFVAALPLGVKAQDVNSYDNYRVACESGAECSDYNIDYEGTEENSDLAQTRRTRRTRSRARTNDTKYYVGGNIAPFIPFDSELDLGFGGGVFAGYKLTKNISAEIEVYDYFGGTEDDDLGFNNFGAVVNGVYRYNVYSSFGGPYIFAGLGVGVGVASATGDNADALENIGIDTSETGFLVQGKGGVGYPLTEKIDVFGQTKFFSIFTDDDDADGVALDVGAKFNF